jgi:hypothetical protein
MIIKQQMIKDQEIRLEYGDDGCYGTLIPREIIRTCDDCWKPYWVIRFNYTGTYFPPEKTIELCIDKEYYELVNF